MRIATGREDNERGRVRIDKPLTVAELAKLLSLKDTEVILRLYDNGIPPTVNQILEVALARETARELGFDVIES
ncbi:MAG TPA: translation initiation factor IF-2 N-terminal domain-containing protein [Planktothrix sp.]|jgi:hypothetical protein